MEHPVVVITGASTGIGAATAERLARSNHNLVIVARNKEALEAVASRSGKTVEPVVADMTVRDNAARVFDRAISRFGQVDVWINNVGQGISRMPSELTDEDIDAMMLVNVKSALYGVQAVLPHFKSRGTGHIINISSMLGRVPFAPVRSAYCGAKHFLNALTATLRMELKATHPGIQVSLVSPGVVATEFGVRARHGGEDSRSFGGAQTAEDVAEVIASVIETRKADVYTRPDGQDLIARYYASDIS
jgi:short-subunit dehydrogenase